MCAVLGVWPWGLGRTWGPCLGTASSTGLLPEPPRAEGILSASTSKGALDSQAGRSQTRTSVLLRSQGLSGEHHAAMKGEDAGSRGGARVCPPHGMASHRETRS